MKPAAYQDVQPEDIPLLNLRGGGQMKIIAGTAQIDNQSISGPIRGLSTEPLFLDVRLPADGYFVHSIAHGHNAFIYLYEGLAEVGSTAEKRPLPAHAVGVLSEGDRMEVHAGKGGGLFSGACGQALTRTGCPVWPLRDEYER
jgi:redox-sensitive bicupin YhaK (pirin superfamily)